MYSQTQGKKMQHSHPIVIDTGDWFYLQIKIISSQTNNFI
jgi:hypothetical protein